MQHPENNQCLIYGIAVSLASAETQSKSLLKGQSPAGHMNERNFVGLSVTADGYIACGSEDNAVYTYYKTLPMPLASHAFEPAGDNRPEV